MARLGYHGELSFCIRPVSLSAVEVRTQRSAMMEVLSIIDAAFFKARVSGA